MGEQEGYGDDFRPTQKWQCFNCGKIIDGDNPVVLCAGCGEKGCTECMVKDINYDEWFCSEGDNKPDIECRCEFLDKVVEKLHKALNGFVLNKPQVDFKQETIFQEGGC
jgi:hypothetical protein